jgi:hypothetical protein
VGACLVGVMAACSQGSSTPWPVAGHPTLTARQASAEREAGSAPTLPSALPGVVPPRCVNAPSGWLDRELDSPGGQNAPASKQVPFDLNPPVQGYLDRTYAACGQALGVHLAAWNPTRVVVEALRVGWYRGGTARLVWRSAPVLVRRQHTLPTQARVTQDNQWPTALTIRPDASWAPGLYLIRFRALDHAAPDTYQPLYVLTSGPHAAYLAIGADLTQLAYGKAGGVSLYRGPGGTAEQARENRAYVASTHRALQGPGTYQLLSMDVPLAIFLAHHRITADWTSDMSLDADASQVEGYATIVIPGHSEYWTRRNYDTLTQAVDGGTNLAVLGANEIYWQTRLTRDAQGSVASMAVYRSAAADPTRRPQDETVQWRQAPLRRDPAALTGLGMAGVGVVGDGRVVSSPSWLFRGTGLQVGGVLKGVYGYEADGPGDPRAPTNEQILLRSQARDTVGHHVVAATGYHSTASGAGVFNAGTTEWVCAITDLCHFSGSRDGDVRSDLDRLTVNLLSAFARPRAGVQHPSTATG